MLIYITFGIFSAYKELNINPYTGLDDSLKVIFKFLILKIFSNYIFLLQHFLVVL